MMGTWFAYVSDRWAMNNDKEVHAIANNATRAMRPITYASEVRWGRKVGLANSAPNPKPWNGLGF